MILAKAGLADFIQPSLGPLQPNLDDYMDTFEPLHGISGLMYLSDDHTNHNRFAELITGKLATVPEENANIGYYNYVDLDLIGNNHSNIEVNINYDLHSIS